LKFDIPKTYVIMHPASLRTLCIYIFSIYTIYVAYLSLLLKEWYMYEVKKKMRRWPSLLLWRPLILEDP